MKKALFLVAAFCFMIGACVQNKNQNTQTRENNKWENMYLCANNSKTVLLYGL